MTPKALVTALTLAATALTAAAQTATAATTETTTYKLAAPLNGYGDCPADFIAADLSSLPQKVRDTASLNREYYSYRRSFRDDLMVNGAPFTCVKTTTTTNVGTGLGGNLGWTAAAFAGTVLVLAFSSSTNNTTTGTTNH